MSTWDKTKKRDVFVDHNEPITKENYTERAVDFVKANGGAGFIIRTVENVPANPAINSPATPDQFEEWLAYLQSKGLKTAYARKTGLASVPAEWPWMFEPKIGSKFEIYSKAFRKAVERIL